ncbi:MAG: SDR family NAD(P)-dependent oxidoreductase [Desulfobacterales bacterium]|nr:SDR family NAD(P)-dependent oxidoreductase [Desulfobacterales bacterium]
MQHIMNDQGTLNYQGLFVGRYGISYHHYQGADFSKICFLFSGQGAAYPGMFLNAYQSVNIIQQYFNLADSLAMKYDLPPLSGYITDTHTFNKTKLPIVRNLSLFTIQVALFNHLLSDNISPKILTGFSFGEFAALVASGIIGFEDMFDFLYHRDIFCPLENVLGVMIAINADYNQIKNILDHKDNYYISNLNSPNQTVISTTKNEVRSIKKSLSRQKIEFKVLNLVPQPYHSPLLKTVASKLSDYIHAKPIKFRKPRIPVLSSVTHALITQDNFSITDIYDILSTQIIKPVDFINQTSKLYQLECYSFLEIGPGHIFSRFVDDILMDKEHKIIPLEFYLPESKSASKGSNAASKNNPFFSLIRKTISKLTGYEIDKISFEDKFQEDLGIDSIKKANIIVTVLKETKKQHISKFNLSEILSIGDIINLLENPQKYCRVNDLSIQKESFFKRYTIDWKPSDLTSFSKPADNNTNSYIIHLRDIIYKGNKGEKNLVSVLCLDETTVKNLILIADDQMFDDNLFMSQNFTFELNKLIKITKYFRDFVIQQAKGPDTKSDINIALVTQQESHPFNIALGAFFKSLKKEWPRLFFKHIRTTCTPTSNELISLVEKEMLNPGQVDVCYMNYIRYVPWLKTIDDPQAILNIGEERVIIAFGGAKGITFLLLQKICIQFQPYLYIIGRSSPEEKTVAANILLLKQYNSKVDYIAFDAQNRSSVEAILAKIHKKHGHIDFIINGVGIEISLLLSHKTDQDIEQELNSKVLAYVNILESSAKYHPEKIITFSSVVARFGNPGQTIYACANEVINQLTIKYNRQIGNLTAISINWPPWDGVGMTANPAILTYLKWMGVSLINIDQAFELMSHEFNQTQYEVVEYFDKQDFYKYLFRLTNYRYFQPLLGELNLGGYFEKDFSLKTDPYLLDHCIEGVSYLPAAIGISMFSCIASLFSNSYMCLKDFHIHNPLIVYDSPTSITIQMQEADKHFLFTMQSTLIHFSCKVFEEDGTRQEVKVNQPEFKAAISPEAIYKEKGLFHGPIFQTIHYAWTTDQNEVCGQIDNSKLIPIYNIPYYDQLILWLDTAFQLLALSALIQNQVMALPISVDLIRFFPKDEISSQITLTPSQVFINEEIIQGNMAILNQANHILVQLEGIKLRVIR